jgi:hypothetical protein
VKESLQDGKSEWVSVLACIGADGTALPPGVILRDFMATSETLGWKRSLRKHQYLSPHHALDGIMMILGWLGLSRSLIGSQREKLGGAGDFSFWMAMDLILLRTFWPTIIATEFC